jgi:hypothetical protein
VIWVQNFIKNLVDMTVQELIDKLKYFDKDMKVVGVNEVKLDTIEKTENGKEVIMVDLI